jgi:hypothetical protein
VIARARGRILMTARSLPNPANDANMAVFCGWFDRAKQNVRNGTNF